jgi:hypothetical protein
MRLNKFGVLYFSNVRELDGGEMSIMSFISQQCSKSIDQYKKNPSIPPRFEKISTQEFMDRCGMGRTQVFDSISGLIKKGFLLKKKDSGTSYFPGDKYFGVGKRHGMIQEEFMINLTKNEKIVYNYLSTCQGNNESCNPSRRQIMIETGMKSIQMVSRVLTCLVRKDVIKRIEVNKQSNIYFVKRITKEMVKSPENVHTKSSEKVHTNEVKSPKKVHHILNNSLKDENNSFLITPASGEKKEEVFLKNEKNLKDMKEGEKENVVISEFVSAPSDTSFRNDFKKDVDNGSVPFTHSMSLTNIEEARREKILNSLSSAEKSHLEKIGLDVREFVNLKMRLWNSLNIKPLSLQKIEESEKNSLRKFIKDNSSSENDEVMDMIVSCHKFLSYQVTLTDYSRSKLDSLLKRIKKIGNVDTIIFKTDIERESKSW